MSEKRKFRVTDLISITVSIITLFTVIASGFFWFYKTNELPARVKDTESRLDKLEGQMIENKTKTDLIYQGVVEIRTVLLKR